MRRTKNTAAVGRAVSRLLVVCPEGAILERDGGQSVAAFDCEDFLVVRAYLQVPENSGLRVWEGHLSVAYDWDADGHVGAEGSWRDLTEAEWERFRSGEALWDTQL